jgi:hypothetical protein
MKTLNIKIYRATNSFLYLPIYIARDLEIFQTVLSSEKRLRDKYQINIVFEDPQPREGDATAIKKMLRDCNDTTVAVAIGSPVAFLNPNMRDDVFKDVKVIGAIINKLTFWAVDHERKTYNKIEDLKGKFSKIIYPKEQFVTGCYLGRKVQQKTDIADENLISVDFDTEINKLREVVKEEKNNTGIAITADIATLAEATIGNDSELHINHHFSKWGDFLTTGIITSRESCEKFSDIIVKVIEAIQKSIAILYSSEKTARKICADIAIEHFSDKFTTQEKIKKEKEESEAIKKIIQLMNDEEFYPADLNISKDGWDKAVKALASTQQWDNDDKNTKNIISDSFETFVDNKFVLDSEKSIAKQFGIDFDTFRKVDIIKYMFTKPFKGAIDSVKKNLKWYLSIFVAIVVFALIFVYQGYTTDKITFKELLLIVIPSIFTYIIANIRDKNK